MIHYHGLPITPMTAAEVAVRAGHAFVSFAHTCAFGPCVPSTCSLVGGCVIQRFTAPVADASEFHGKARALAGSLPARTNRDPRQIKRKRKELTR